MFATGVDSSATETKGTVLIHSAEQVNYDNFLILFLNRRSYERSNRLEGKLF